MVGIARQVQCPAHLNGHRLHELWGRVFGGHFNFGCFPLFALRLSAGMPSNWQRRSEQFEKWRGAVYWFSVIFLVNPWQTCKT